jgi:hypothetical protein
MFYVEESTGKILRQAPSGACYQAETKEQAQAIVDEQALPWARKKASFKVLGWLNTQVDFVVVNQRGEVVEVPTYANVNGYHSLRVEE